ncbi:MAG: 1-phosphofructokinase [Fusobacteriaceae bacterium]|jgi:1-phosphofructokinase|nr:1-phosphofructokinase [Fusobacteriaceae bacterium]
MVFTVTLNPAIDYYVAVDNFIEGKLNLASESYMLPGGKGINVSKVLKNYGVQSIALGFVGGSTGDYIRKKLKKYGIIDRFIEIDENTRINIKLKTNKSESEISGKSPEISKEKYEEFIKTLDDIGSHDYLSLSGSVPKSLPDKIYSEIIKKLSKGVKVILDTRGEAFTEALNSGVFLTKPNKIELGEFLKKEINNLDDIINGAKKLQDMGSENVLVSTGGENSVLVTKNGIYIGNTPKGNVVSSVGAGDSMVAGIIYGLSKGLTIEESYRYGICSGSATAFKNGLADLESMSNLLSECIINKL